MIASFARKSLTKLELTGITIPAGADLGISVSVQPISQAADFRRSVNGDLHNVARSHFQKLAVSISGSHMRPAPLHTLNIGQYIEVIAPEPHALSLPLAQISSTIPRSSQDVVGIAEAGHLVLPTSQPPSHAPLQGTKDPARIATLRSPQNISFPEPVVVVRYRPILACSVVNWSSDADEHRSSAGWSLQLEEC